MFFNLFASNALADRGGAVRSILRVVSPTPTATPTPSPTPTPTPTQTPTPTPTPGGGGSSGGGCFLAGTKILMADGKARAIEDITTGAWVRSVDFENGGILVAARVYATLSVERGEYWVINGEIKTTAEHPFYVIGRGWEHAAELKVGMELRAVDESPILIESIVHVLGDVRVFNISVGKTENFFAEGVLVHNKKPPVTEGG